MEILDFGVCNYHEIWEKQKTLQQNIISAKKEGKPFEEFLLLGEHFPVYTLGVHGKRANLLVDETTLNKRNCEIIRIERGGDITYHGPGQLIVYPIIDLERYKLGVKSYIYLLEECVIRLLLKLGIKGERIDSATGVWIDKGKPTERKICAIGVKISRYVTMHGLSLNVSTDLSDFELINPCGFKDKGVTSIEKETGRHEDMNWIKEELKGIFLRLLPTKNVNAGAANFRGIFAS